MSDKTIEEFLLDRIADTERELEGLPMRQWILLQKIFANQRYVVEWARDNWPVMVEGPDEFDMALNTFDDYRISLTRKMEFMIQKTYREKFGTEPPTAPLLREMAMMYAEHKDWKEEWRV